MLGTLAPLLRDRWIALVEREHEPDIPTGAYVLDVGCGQHKRRGAVGIDRLADTDADVLHELNAFPYPFDDNTFDAVVARHVIEHLDEPLVVMAEFHRITRPGGSVFIVTPHFSSPTSWIDPTHKHHLAAHSFDYLMDGTPWNFYSEVRYTVIRRRVTLGMAQGPRGRVLPLLRLSGFEALINRHLDGFERWWAFTLPLGNRDLIMSMRVVK
ncbi:MAG: class I SAM-dependent methyltransferase [Solirubrobacteraceae bacterium]